MNDALMANYQRLPIAFERGEGVWLWDIAGDRYLDALSGIAVCGLGHCHPEVTSAIAEQAGKLVHTSNLYEIPIQRHLAEQLTGLARMENVFFCNSGAEANEAAIKLARLHARRRNVEDPVIAVAEGSFHGRTMATLSATGNRKVREGFEPLLGGFRQIPFGDLEAARSLDRDRVVAIMVEPIQGENGIVIPPAGYLAELRRLCDRNDWLLMCDEIQTGLCRTGRWFACRHEEVVPDVMTLAKALGNGVPIGACLSGGRAADLMRPGKHGSTFGGNPLACSAALAVLRVLNAEALDERAATLGARLLSEFQGELSGLEVVADVRGKGLMIGIELREDCGDLMRSAIDQRLLINVTAERVIRLLPPLVTSDDDAAMMVERTVSLVKNFQRR